jgi:hypothetical protein
VFLKLFERLQWLVWSSPIHFKLTVFHVYFMSDEERLFFRCASEVLDSVNSLFRVGGVTYANDYYLDIRRMGP